MKNFKTNSAHVQNLIKRHILESVYDYQGQQFESLQTACDHLNNEFKRVGGKRITNHVDRFKDYLQGIPFHFEYTNDGLQTFLNSLGINNEGREYSSDKSWNLYALLIYREMEKAIK